MATKRKRKLQRAARAAARRRQDAPPESAHTFHRTDKGPEMQARQYAAISASYNRKRRR